MNALLTEHLQSLLDAHVGQDQHRTPLLNRALLLHDTLLSTSQGLQALAQEAPVLGEADSATPQHLHDASLRYWNDLAPGALVSRFDHAKALRGEDLSLRAELLAVSGEISDAGQQLLAAMLEPVAGQAAPVAHAAALQRADGSRMKLPGVVLLEATPEGRCLVVFPGLTQQLFEFASRTAAGHGLIEFLLSASAAHVWTFLEPQTDAVWRPSSFADDGVKVTFRPLTHPFLDYGLKGSIAKGLKLQQQADPLLAQACVAQRAEWFWRSLPLEITAAVTGAVKADGARQSRLLTFANTSADIAASWIEQQLAVCVAGIQRYIGDDLDSYEHKRYRQIHASWQAAQDRTEQVLNEMQGALASHDWRVTDAAGLSPRHRLAASLGSALQYDAQLQVYEGSLSAEAFALITKVASRPVAQQREADGTVVAELAVGDAGFAYRLPGAFIFAPPQAWSAPEQAVPVVLFMTGESGGSRGFASLRQLLDCVAASLKDPAFAPVHGRYALSVQPSLSHLLAAAPVPLVTTPVSDNWIEAHLETVFDAQEGRLPATADEGLRSRARSELAKVLRQPEQGVRDLAVDRIAEQRRLQAVLQGLPAELSGATDAQRAEFAGLLADYNRLAGAQERYLDAELPNIHSFVYQVLKARLSADLGRPIEPEPIQLHLPDSVEIKVVANVPSEILVPSHTSRSWSLIDLALLNIDRQMTLRLRYARLVDARTGAELQIDGLTVEYLRRLIIELDVAAQYRNTLVALFSLGGDESAGNALRTQILVRPYRAALRLEAFMAVLRGDITRQARLILERALAARTSARLSTELIDVQLHSVRLSLGEGSDKLASGLLVIEERLTGTYLLYLPQPPEGPSIMQAASVDQLKDGLLRRLRSASMRTWLGGQAGLGRSNQAREGYLLEALARDFTAFMSVQPMTQPVWPVSAALLRNREQKLLDDVRLIARSRADVRAAFARQLGDDGKQLLWSGLYYLPVIGTALQLYDGWKDAGDAVEAFRADNPALGLRRMASAEINFGFALVSFLPGMAAAPAARRALGSRKAPPVAAVHVGQSKPRIDGFAGHEVNINLMGAVPQQGINAGTWKQGGKLYLWQDATAYEVFRRRGELTLRLRRTPVNSYEHPVRLRPDGRFVTHVETGLRAGGRSRPGSGADPSESTMAQYLIRPEDREAMVTTLKRANKYTLDDLRMSLPPRAGDVAIDDFKVRRQQLHRDAVQHLDTVEVPPRVALPELAVDVATPEMIAALYSRSNGLVIGEAHFSAASKRFLIEQFDQLKAEGVRTLYFEHLLVDFYAEDLRTLNQTGIMPSGLARRLRDLDSGHQVDTSLPYTFEEVIIQANKAGLEVVSLDCATAWYAKGLGGVGAGARQRMFSYIASETIKAHQAARGEHKWVALVGNSHTNVYGRTLGLAELNGAIGLRIAEPEAAIPPRLRPDPGLETAFSQGTVKADFLLEVEVPQGAAGPSFGIRQVTELLPAAPRLWHPGSFYMEKVEGQRVIVHLSRDGLTYRTPVKKNALGIYSVSRPSWDKVHGRHFLTLKALIKAMDEQKLSLVQQPT